MKPKLKTCKAKGCRQRFETNNSFHVACSLPCSVIIVEQDKEKKRKAQRVIDRAKLEEMRPIGYYKKRAQAAFNKYIRERDYGNKCISSNREMDWNAFGGKVDAGHYRSVGSAPHLRFNTYNCHAQSVKDNQHGSGSVTDYRINLIKKIGIDKVEILEADQTVRKFTKEYLIRVAKVFNKRARLLNKKRGLNLKS